MGSLNRKLYVDNKNGLNLEYMITIKSAQTLLGEWRFSLFLPNLLTPAGNFRRFKNCHFRSTSLKLGSLNRKLFINFKNGLNFYYTIINKSVDPYSKFFRHPVILYSLVSYTKSSVLCSWKNSRQPFVLRFILTNYVNFLKPKI